MIEVQVSRVFFCKGWAAAFARQGSRRRGKGKLPKWENLPEIFLLGHGIRYHVLSRQVERYHHWSYSIDFGKTMNAFPAGSIVHGFFIH